MSVRCSICPNKNRCVPGDGPFDTEVFCIGEAPGYEEDHGGVPFIGRAGREFNEHYLGLAGLDRDGVYIDNTVSCRPDLNRKPSSKEIWGCAPHHIPQKLELIKPRVVLLMGGTACSLLEQQGQAKPDLDAEHGIPRWGKLWDWEGWIVPMYHPAAGLHNTSMMQPLMEDWSKLRWWLEDGKWMWAEDKYKTRDYRLFQSWTDVDRYFDDHMPFGSLWVGADTESHAGKNYSVQISIEPGSGGLVLWENQDVVQHLAKRLREFKVRSMVYHYAPADLPLFGELGLGEIPYRDTMQEAYGLTIWPQALKVIARRWLGRIRKSWEETVLPPSKLVLSRWMRDALRHAERSWRTEEQRYHKKTGKPLKPKVTVSKSEKLLPELFGHMTNNSDYKIWDKLYERLPEDELAKLIMQVGPVPVKGVAHLGIWELVEYGCSDADDTLTAALLFEQMRKEFVERLDFQEEDRDR